MVNAKIGLTHQGTPKGGKMSEGRSFNRFHRFLARKHRQFLRKFVDREAPKDVLLLKFKRRKTELAGK